jgi:hypothetical protein
MPSAAEPGRPRDQSDAGSDYPIGGPALRLAGDRHEATPLTTSAGPSVLANVAGTGQPHRGQPGEAGSVRLRGRTDANFNGGAFSTVGVRTSRSTACDGCSDTCRRATGTLVVRMRANPRVTLPRVSDFPNLTPCQVTRVRNAIRNVLAPHEQEHVAAFNQYNATVRRPFDLTVCSSTEFDSRIQEMFEAIEQPRRAAAQAASDVLDPFYFDVDIDCQEPPPTRRRRRAAAERPTPEEQLA